MNMYDSLKASFKRLDYMFCWFSWVLFLKTAFQWFFEKKGWKWRKHHITRMRLDFIKKMLNDDEEAGILLNDKLEFCNHTIQVNGKTDVIFSYLRVGIKGSVADNLHSGGIRFPINHHTGEIYVGMNYQINDIERHLDSGIRIAGETIPNWSEICSFCKDAHERAPQSLRFIGWGVCLDENDMCLIEGNSGPGFPLIEDPDDDWWGKIKGYFSKLESACQK